MAEHRSVVIVGGGAVGNATLYGLARRGVTDALLIEKGRLTSGSTWMAAGLLPSYARSRTVTKVINRSIEIYRGLDLATNHGAGLHLCGQMRIARTPGRMDEYQSYMDIVPAVDTTARLLTPAEVFEIWPLIEDRATVLGALYHPEEGHISPTDITMTLSRAARALGAEIREQTWLRAVAPRPAGGWRLFTSQGEITCDDVVLATGLHARRNAALFGMDLPAFPLCVQYWITDPVPEIVARKASNRAEFPIVRDELFDGYTREERDGFLFGFYERPENLELFHPEGLDPAYENQLLPANLDGHAEFMEIALGAIPALGRAAVRSNTRGAMQMTPDGLPLAGPGWGVDNVWLAEGVPGGILWGGGIGHALSAWIVEGAPPLDMAELDPRRFTQHATPAWAQAKVRETWGLHAQPHVPGEEHPAGRPGRTTPIHDRLLARGAVMGANAGWEMPLWYAPEGVAAVDDVGFRASRHGRHVGDEVAAVRGGAGLIELSQMAKYEVSGPGAAAALDRLLAGRLPAVGRCCQAYQLFPEGGVAANYTVARLADDLFYLIAVPRAERMNLDLLRRDLPRDGSVILRNTTVERGILVVAGPEARGIVQSVVEADLSTGALPWRGVTVANAGLAPDVRVLRLSLTGETAWELHHPISYQRALFEALMAAGAGAAAGTGAGTEAGLRLVGNRALGALRLDKSYREFGMDLHREISPLRAGLGRFVALDKDFIGRAALQREAREGLATRVAVLALDPGEGSPIRHEAVYHDGRLAGRVTSGGWSWHLGRDLAFALLPADLTRPGTMVEVSVLGHRRPAQVIPDSPYDPENRRLKA